MPNNSPAPIPPSHHTAFYLYLYTLPPPRCLDIPSLPGLGMRHTCPDNNEENDDNDDKEGEDDEGEAHLF